MYFWHPANVEEWHRVIGADVDADPKMMVPCFRRHHTRFLTKAVGLISRFYLDDTLPNHDLHRTNKMGFYSATTSKVVAL